MKIITDFQRAIHWIQRAEFARKIHVKPKVLSETIPPSVYVTFLSENIKSLLTLTTANSLTSVDGSFRSGVKPTTPSVETRKNCRVVRCWSLIGSSQATGAPEH